MADGHGEGREVSGGAKPPGRAGQGLAFSPEPACGLLCKNISKENSALANGEILRAPINGEAGEGPAVPRGWGSTRRPLGTALPKAHVHAQTLTVAQNEQRGRFFGAILLSFLFFFYFSLVV